MIYTAFISYSHASDDKLAPALQSALHRFAKPWYRHPAIRVCLDKTSLSANPALWPSIEKSLAESEYLLLLGSPEAAHSPWVTREIDWWLKNRSPDRLLILVTHGRIGWDREAVDFDWQTTTALPHACAGHFKHEPLYVDLTWVKNPATLSLRHSRFRAAVLDIAATLHGTPKDELDSDDVRHYRRARRLAWMGGVALVTVAVIAVAAGIVARMAQRDAQEQRGVAVEAAKQAEQSAQDARYQEGVARQEADKAIKAGQRAELHRLEAVGQQQIAENRRVEAERQQQEARARELAARADFENADSGTGLLRQSLLALESLKSSWTLEGYLTWARAKALRATPVFRTKLESGGRLLQFNPDGDRLAISDGASVRILDARTGAVTGRIAHGGVVAALDFSADGRRLATAGEDGLARVWEVETGKELGHVAQGTSVSAIAFSATAGRLGTAGDRTVTVWNLEKWEAAATLQHEEPVHELRFLSDGRRLATRTWGSVHVWDIGVRRMVFEAAPEYGREDAFAAATLSRDARWFAVARLDEIDLWDLASGNRRRLDRMDDRVTALAFATSGARLAAGNRRSSTGVWETTSGRRLANLHDGESLSGVTRIALSGDGSIVSMQSTGLVRAWQLNGSEILRTPAATLHALAISPDGCCVATSTDRTSELWRAGTGAESFRLLHAGPVQDLSFSPDGQTLATASQDRTARMWNVSNGAELHRLTHPAGVMRVRFSPRGKWLATVGQEVAPHLWNVEQIREIPLIAGRGSPFDYLMNVPLDVAFSPDTDWLLMGAGGHGPILGEMRFWHIPTGRPGLRLNTGVPPESIAVRPDGRSIVIGGGDGQLRIWELDRPTEAKRINAHRDLAGINTVAFSPDGRLLVSASDDHTVKIWNAATMSERARIDHTYPVRMVRFDRSGRIVVSAGGEDVRGRGESRVIESATGREIVRIDHEASVQSVALTSDGRFMATASLDRAVRVFQTGQAREMARMTHAGRVLAMAFSPDGKYLATGSEDGSARLWLWSRDDLVGEGCTGLGSNFTFQQWRQYMHDAPYAKTCPGLPLDESVVEFGRALARSGRVAAAVDIFRQAVRLEPQLNLNPLVDARRLAAPSRIRTGEDLAKKGRIVEAIASFKEGRQFDPSFKLGAERWTTLCWYGAAWGQAARVAQLCEDAVRTTGGGHDARGLVRALVGNRIGAIEDFKVYLTWAREDLEYSMFYPERIRRREAWIRELESGRNPFDKQTLEELRKGEN